VLFGHAPIRPEVLKKYKLQSCYEQSELTPIAKTHVPSLSTVSLATPASCLPNTTAYSHLIPDKTAYRRKKDAEIGQKRRELVKIRQQGVGTLPRPCPDETRRMAGSHLHPMGERVIKVIKAKIKINQG
jgi:hypothetical protein